MAALNDVLDCCTMDNAVIQGDCTIGFLSVKGSELMVISDCINEKTSFYSSPCSLYSKHRFTCLPMISMSFISRRKPSIIVVVSVEIQIFIT